MNYIFANPSMKNGETWTPICIPGIREEFFLYVYIKYFNLNLGVILISTDHSHDVFFECQKSSEAIYLGILEKNLIEVIDKCTMQMFLKFSKIENGHNSFIYEGDIGSNNQEQSSELVYNLQLSIID